MKHEIGMSDFDDSYDWQPSNKKNYGIDKRNGAQPAQSTSDQSAQKIDFVPEVVKQNFIDAANYLTRIKQYEDMPLAELSAVKRGAGYIQERQAKMPAEPTKKQTTEIKAKPLEKFSTPAASPAAARTLVLAR